MIEMIPLFRLFSVMDHYRRYFSSNIDQNINANRALNHSTIQFGSAISTISEMSRYTVLVATIVLCALKKISLGDVVLYQSLFSFSLDGLGRIMNILPNLEMGLEAMNSIYSVLGLEDTGETKITSHLTDGELKFEGVHFTYPGSESKALSGVDCRIRSGEHVVIIGKNGSGKSTLARLLLGFFAPDRGRITINGVLSTDAGSEAIATKIAYVSQRSIIFRDSLLENIRLRDEQISREQALKAAEQCNLARLISRLSLGLDEPISPLSLSGGETQCVAIARALARPLKTLLLDEITSNLDLISKKMVFNTLRNLHGSCTIVTITHDMELLTLADRVLVMDEGKLHESNLNSVVSG
ncbi:ABC transporter ATP-binding protein [Desulfobacter postgatei]|jgi:ABC-type bacteriocin/lantibiotic exporter with double-glycine peptidase domain|uniref:ABC transporter ATP-binding protein n=1 Tax=Desulfobacter postgatei TaxID=2293 RepID=UPI002A36C4F3|nr:ABC transporter ATP-binding protein [Desulfobacter postgatei]MDX9963522.1 ABC transporter ATP-binding protein [Desulfobacter postgatei]